MAKCAASTSASLGVRLCGMQVYQANLDHYMKRDKYWGRELTEDGFKGALHNFFHNGYRLRTKVIAKVLGKLEQLRRVIEKQSSYRFYSCVVTDDDNNRERRIDSTACSREAHASETKIVPFVPISEETIYPGGPTDDGSTSPSDAIPMPSGVAGAAQTLTSSSPHSMDSWMNYSSNSNSSSDDYASSFVVPNHLQSSSAVQPEAGSEFEDSFGGDGVCDRIEGRHHSTASSGVVDFSTSIKFGHSKLVEQSSNISNNNSAPIGNKTKENNGARIDRTDDGSSVVDLGSNFEEGQHDNSDAGYHEDEEVDDDDEEEGEVDDEEERQLMRQKLLAGNSSKRLRV
uniref:Kinase n=1 Tax=Anopheles melas TaxID=34690 RepID=A0A182TG67_9DIPT